MSNKVAIRETGEARAVKSSALESVVAATRELTPILAERAREGEANRRTADDLIERIAEAGVFRITQPAAFGGLGETGIASVATSQHIARGDGSASWIVINLHASMWAVGQMKQQAQDDVWGSDTTARVCTVTAPRGPARRVTGGGRVLDGIWPFATGCLHSQWALLGVLMQDADGEFEEAGLALVPMADIVIRDDWNVSGFRGTGSNTLELNNVFVPDHRIIPLEDILNSRMAFEGATPGTLYHGTALSSLFAIVAFGPAIGLVDAAYDAFIGRLPGKEVAYGAAQQQQIDSQIIHYHAAEARMASHVTQLLADECNRFTDASALAGTVLSDAHRGQLRASLAWGTKRCLDAGQLLMSDAGGRGISDNSPLARIVRDLQALHNHGQCNSYQTLSSWGAGLLGLPQPIPLR